MSGDFLRDSADWGTAGRGGRAFDERRRREQDAPDLAGLTSAELDALDTEDAQAELQQRRAALEFLDISTADLPSIFDTGCRAFSDLWSRHVHAAAAVAWDWSRGNREVQETIMGDAGLSLWKSAKRNPLKRSFRAMARVGAKRAGQEYQRRTERERRRGDAVYEEWLRVMADDTEPDPRTCAVGGAGGDHLLQAMAEYIDSHYPHGDARLFRLRMFEGLSHEGLAIHLEIPVTRVNGRLARLRAWLRTHQAAVLRYAAQRPIDFDNGGAHE